MQGNRLAMAQGRDIGLADDHDRKVSRMSERERLQTEEIRNLLDVLFYSIGSHIRNIIGKFGKIYDGNQFM